MSNNSLGHFIAPFICFFLAGLAMAVPLSNYLVDEFAVVAENKNKKLCRELGYVKQCYKVIRLKPIDL